jgi:polyhydroxyalkanoate synthesis repressor PhaR
MAEPTTPPQAPVTIKKYANRRLYNTATSSYVTLDHLCQMVKDGVDFVVLRPAQEDYDRKPFITMLKRQGEGIVVRIVPTRVEEQTPESQRQYKKVYQDQI